MLQDQEPSRPPASPGWAARTHGVVLVLTALCLLAGGVSLVALGGSPYYLLAGLAIAISGVMAWRGRRLASVLYAAVLLCTLAWALSEAGFAPWALIARLAMLSVIGIPFLFRRQGITEKGAGRGARHLGGRTAAAGLLAALALGAGVHALQPARVDPTTAIGMAATAPERLARPMADITRDDWQQYGNNAGGTRFSPLAQITPENANRLRVAWTADIGGGPLETKASLEVTPINIGDAVYLCNAYNVVLSLDAETGAERWRFDMTTDRKPAGKPCRGVSYYRVPGATGICAERIVATNQTPELIALDARTGQPCPEFGKAGRVRLIDGFGNMPTGYTYVSSAPQIVRGKIVFGGAVQDGQFWGEPSGVIRAYDAVTGKFAWAFDLGNPDDHSEPTGDRTYTPATPNSWAPPSADETLGLVYLPIGNATPDFFGGQRRPFDDAFASSVIALDAETGALRWRYQTVHHDIWDYDVPAQPTLVDLPTAGGIRHALIQPTKRGEIFVLDRTDGRPIKTVEERAVPQGGIAQGERLSPTQPFSVGMPSFRSADLRESDMWGMTPIDQMMCRILFKRSRYEGPFTPHTVNTPTIAEPGYSGGVNWGGVSVDIDRGIMVVNSTRVPARTTLVSRDVADQRGFKRFDGTKTQSAPNHPQENTAYGAQPAVFLSPLGVPCNAPPWGLLTAVDLVSGKVVWTQPFGTGQDSGPLGIRSHLPVTMGVPNIGGSVTTRGGLIFVGATADGMFRAFDTATGKMVWEDRLPGGGQATPMSYRSARSGRQFVVIAAGGKPSMGTRISSQVVAYALPE